MPRAPFAEKDSMELELKRDPSTENGTFGKLYAAGVFCCHTLEDEVREVPEIPVQGWKVKSETAIPRGRYKVIISKSQRFKKDLPLLLNVPGFEGIRIHPGNTNHDTEGCILVGQGKTDVALTESRAAFAEAMEDIRGAIENGEEVWVTVA
jgi:hypothetical protein